MYYTLCMKKYKGNKKKNTKPQSQFFFVTNGTNLQQIKKRLPAGQP